MKPTANLLEKPPLQFDILIAGLAHTGMAEMICEEIASSAKARGTGIAKRTPRIHY